MIIIDWLQINCYSKNYIKNEWNKKYTLKKLDYQTRHFKTVQEIWHKQNLIGTVVSDPHSKIINANTLLIKFDNKFLYQKNIKWEVDTFLAINNLQLKNISRIDIAKDFNAFENNLNPEELISKFLSNEYCVKGKSQFKVIGNTNRKNTFEYLSFGSGTSNVVSYLYNKTKEMKAVKWKPYIFDTWKKNDLDINKDIWRLEFRITGKAKSLIDSKTGDIDTFSGTDILKPENIVKTFFANLKHYFAIVIKGNDSNKARWKNVVLFKKETPTILLKDLSTKVESNRSDKIFIKKLYSYGQEVIQGNIELYQKLEDCFNSFASSRGLSRWLTERVYS